jgi:hypothetical protein
MPEYFRSQRQIIIDSEKLLREKKRITKQNFNERSNELGYDQKVLRLRYGQFLGEEFESGVGPQTANENEREGGDITKEFGHQHDSENEHNLVEEKAIPGETHSHHQENSLPGQAKNPLEEFVHAHDSDEEASFFVQSIKAKLKAAVTIMWDAELYLRLYQPEKSLPYQYQALKLLKEISQDSRIYVHRTGFDPPPLKEDKRLTGDLSEIRTSASNVLSTGEEDLYPSIRTSLAIIEQLVADDSIHFSENTKEVLSKAGHELATLALTQPAKFLTTLSSLKQIIQDEVKPRDRKKILIKIRSDMWKALPYESLSPRMPSGTLHELDKVFLESLEKVKLNN